MTQTTNPSTSTGIDDSTTSIETVVDTNLVAYGSTDPAERERLLRQVWAADGRLIDPPIDGAGLDGISQMMATVQGLYPGTFRRTSAVDVHHGVARYSWELVAGDGTVSLAGLDIADVGTDGRLTRIVGFLGDLPAA